MADTASTNLLARLPETGTYEDVWGDVLNTDTFNIFDAAITDIANVTLSGPTFSLPALVIGTASVSRAMALNFTGTPPAPVAVTIPGTVKKKSYLLLNQCGQAVTIGYATGTTVTVANNEMRLVLCNSAGSGSVTSLSSNSDAATLNGVAAALYARRDVANIFLKTNSHPWADITEAPTTLIDAGASNHQKLTLTGNRIMGVPTGPVDGQEILVRLLQDVTGNRQLTWNGIFEWQNGSPPVLTSVPGASDLVLLQYDADDTTWFATHLGAYFSAGGGAAFDFVIDSCGIDVSLLELVGTVGAPVTLNLTIARGAILQAGSTGSWALDLYNALPIGSTINLVNLGACIGRGGDGGDGAALADQGAGLGGLNNTVAYAGRAGGVAIRGPGAGITLNVTNINGKIWGGGGGGGGGGATLPGAGIANGGGGGGGAGGGEGGKAGHAWTGPYGVDGGYGRTGVLGTNGAGGAGSGAGGGGTGASAGDGGTYGAAGVAGSGVTPGSAGAAGKAIELMGGSISWVSGNSGPNVLGAVS